VYLFEELWERFLHLGQLIYLIIAAQFLVIFIGVLSLLQSRVVEKAA
jgi:hypothetical protein